MIDLAYVQRMARYNRWQNQNLYGVADTLPDDERRRERGAFFGSIHKTLSHLLWADRVWMSRFGAGEKLEVGIPQSVSLYPDWEPLKRERAAFDETIIGWADKLDDAWLAGDLDVLCLGAQREFTKPKWLVVTHLFNHQTHHRGQVHCMLTQAGGKPDDTDLLADAGVTRCPISNTLEQEILAAVAGAVRRGRARSRARRGARQERLGVGAAAHARHDDTGRSARPKGRASTGSRTASPRRSRHARMRSSTRRSTPGSTPRPSTSRCRCASRRPKTGRIHPISQVIDELTAIFADMGFAVAEGPDIETDDLNFTKLNIPREPSGAGHARHVLLQSEAGRLAPAAAHPHLARAGAHHAEPEAADPRDHPGPHLSHATPTRPTRRCFIRSRGW